jgi:hypothetical protein
MYLEDVSSVPFTTTPIKIKYDCCNKEHILKWKDAKKNFEVNVGKHICRICKLTSSENPAKRPEVKEKAKKTIEQKYGGVLPINTPDQISKRKEKFKNQNFVEHVLEKRKETCMEKYGVDHHMKCDIGKDAVKAAMQEKYGVDYPLQAEEVKEKMRETCQERYGVDNVMDVPEVKAKMAQTMMDRYGVEHYNQLPEMRQYLRENCTNWLSESYENPWNLGVPLNEETKTKISETIKNLIFSGHWHGGFKSNTKGVYNAKKCKKLNPRFLSSLELQTHFYFDNDPNVEWYNYEALVIPYLDQEGKKHLYFPDFLVKYKENPVLYVYETKCYKNKDKIDVLLKYEAALEYAKNNNLVYKILFDEDVKKFGLDLDKLKTSHLVKLD